MGPLRFPQFSPSHQRPDDEAEPAQDEQAEREPTEESVVKLYDFLGSSVQHAVLIKPSHSAS